MVSDKTYQQLIEQVIDDLALIFLDKKGKIGDWNKGAEKILGYSRDEVAGKNFYIFYTREQRDEHLPQKMLRDAGKNGNVTYDGWWLKKDGTRFWGSIAIKALYDEDEHITGFLKIVRDLTVQKEYEELLKGHNYDLERRMMTRTNELVVNKISTQKQIDFERNNLDALINSTRDMMWSIDREYRLITANNAFDELVKQMGGEPIRKGDNVLESSFPAEQLQRFKNFYDRAFAGESFTEVEYTRYPEDYWNEISFYPIRREHEIIGTACHAHDITAIKKAEEKIVHANWLYAFISQVNQAIVRAKDEQGLFKQACRIAIEFGKFRAAWVGLFDKKNTRLSLVEQAGMLPGEAAHFIDIPFNQDGPQGNVLHTGRPHTCNSIEEDVSLVKWYAITKRLGWCACMVLPLKKSGVVVGTFNVISSEKNFFGTKEIDLLNEATIDISFALDAFENDRLRKKAEEELFQSKANLSLIIDLIPQAIYAINRNGSLVFANKSFAAFSGYVPGELFDRNIADVIPVYAEVEKLTAYARDVIKSRRSKVIPEMVFPDLFGNKHSFYTIAVPYTLAGTNERIALIISLDITAQKHADEERIKMIADMLQRNKDLEQFSYIVSHNLRAPVANIIGISELLQGQLDPADKETLSNELFTSVKKLDSVIRDLNYILQIKYAVKEKKELVRFDELVADIKISIDNLLRNDDVDIETDFTDASMMPTLKSYLYSIFFNLITNSIKYHKPGEKPRIHIKSRREGKKIVLTFKDNGLGIDLEKRGRQIFGMYKRFHMHTEGKGMGLYMVKTQVELLGGKITVDSKVNMGTEFTITF
jgi:PAS domain S-box-containing protein